MSLRPKPSIGAVKLSFRDAFFAFDDAPVVDVVVVLVLMLMVVALSPFVLNVLDVPFEVEKPSVDGEAGACEVCGRPWGCGQLWPPFCARGT